MNKHRPFWNKILIVVAAFGTTVGSIGPFIDAIIAGNILLFIFWIILFIAIANIIIFNLISQKRVEIKLDVRSPFQGIMSPQDIKPWPRRETNDLEEKILACSVDANGQSFNRPVIVVGKSGVGKSVLLNEIRRKFETLRGWEVQWLYTYGACRLSLSDLFGNSFSEFDKEAFKNNDNAPMKNIDISKNMLLILDQFEQFIYQYDNVHTNRKNLEFNWFREFMRNTMAFESIRVVIAIRKEWYYDTRFLEDLVPTPFQAFNLGGIKCNSLDFYSPKDHLTMMLRNVIGTPDSTEKILEELIDDDGRISPAEVQTVGLVLQNIKDKFGTITKKIYQKEVKSKANLIRRYFASHVDHSSNPQITRKVLFSLSAKTDLRQRLEVPQIMKICHERQNDIKKCLDEDLITKSLVQCDEGGNKYELSHDFLADQYREISATDLDPRERDNILYYTDATLHSPRQLEITSHQEKLYTLWDIFFLLPMLVFAIRLGANLPIPTLQGFFSWVPFGILPASPWSGALMLPILLAHTSWAFFVRDFHHNFLSSFKEDFFGLSVTTFFRLTGAVCNILAAFLPLYWLVFIGVGGSTLGIKLLQLAWANRACKVARTFFFEFGGGTVCNMFVYIILGWILAKFAQFYRPSDVAIIIYTFISLVVAIVTVSYAIMLYPRSSSRSAASMMQGLCDRIQEQDSKDEFNVKLPANRAI